MTFASLFVTTCFVSIVIAVAAMLLWATWRVSPMNEAPPTAGLARRAGGF